MADTSEKKVARFAEVPGKSRTKTVDLDWPVEFDGKRYNSVTLKRCSMGEWRQFWDAVAAHADAKEPGDEPVPPYFVEPAEVFNALDPDDDAKVAEVIEGFFPQRFKPKTERSESASKTGGSSLPNSSDT